MSHTDLGSNSSEVITKKDERRAFLFLAVFLFPILAVAVVGSYGFLIWMTQLIVGPPTG